MIFGVGGAQVLSLLAAPVIARLFNPEDFGVVALFISIVAILVIPTTLRLEQAAVLPRTNLESSGLISIAIFATVICFIVSSLALLIAYFFNISQVTDSALGRAVFLLPSAVLLTGFTSIAMGCATRLKAFKAIGRGNIAQSLGVVCSRILAGFLLGSSSLALVVTVFFGLLFKLTILLRAVARPKVFSLFVPKYHVLKQVISEYRQFPIYSVPTGLLRAFNDNLPVLVLAALFTPQVVGLYAMASRLVRVPVMVISEPIRLAYLQKSSELVRQGQSVERSLLLLTLALLLLSLPIVLSLALFGRELFHLLLGSKWTDAGTYAAIVAPWFASRCVQMPSSCIYIVAKKQKHLLLLQSGTTVAMCLSMAFVAVLKLDAIAALVALAAIGTSLNLMIILNAYFIARRL